MGVIRLFLAWVVAIDHWRVLVLIPRSAFTDDNIKFGFNAGYAVMFFYVISGFLITFTLSRNYATDVSGTARFYRNRFVRIYSLYWPMVLLSFLTVGSALPSFLAASLPDKLTGIFLLGMDWRISFTDYPKTHFAAAIVGLGQAWTLGVELTFYLVAPWLMRSWRAAVAVLAASFGLRAYFVITLGPALHDIWTYHFALTSIGFFMLGHLVCRAALKWPLLNNRMAGCSLAVLSFVVMTVGGSYIPFDGQRFWGSILLFTLALPGLFEATKGIRWMNWIGDLSYPVYLVHILVFLWFSNFLIDQTLPKSGSIPLSSAYSSIAAFLAVTTAAAIVSHRLIEVPVSWAMQRLLAAASGKPARRRTT